MATIYPGVFTGTPLGTLPATIVLPNGRTGWLNPYKGTYTENRTYNQRLQRGWLRGESQSTARGHKPIGGLTESQWRRLKRLYVDEINYRTWENAPSNRMKTRGGERTDPRIFKQDVQYIVELFQEGYHDPNQPTLTDWLSYTEFILALRLDATIEHQEFNNSAPGRQNFFSRSDFWQQEGFIGFFQIKAAPPIQMWWYH